MGARGHKEELGVTGMDATASSFIYKIQIGLIYHESFSLKMKVIQHCPALICFPHGQNLE